MARLSDIICKEMFWAAKAAHSIESGYVRLEMAEDGQYREALLGDNAYYVCAAFADGRHVPLPLLLPGGSIDSLQARVIESAREAGQLDECIDDCARFALASGSHDESLTPASADWLEKRDPAFVFAAMAYISAIGKDYFLAAPVTQVAAAALKEICGLRGIKEVA